MKNSKTLRMVQLAMISAISVALVSITQFPFPPAQFLKFDLADMPIFLSAMLFGIPSGWLVLTVVSFVQAFMMGGDSIIGFLMHMIASGLMLTVAALVYNRFHHWKGAAGGLLLGTLARTAIMIPLNLIFTVHFLGVPQQAVMEMLVPAIIPFNLLQGVLNTVATLAMMGALKPVMKKLAI